jgi:hypothetical protein
MTLALHFQRPNLLCLFERYGAYRKPEIQSAQAPSPYFLIDLSWCMDPRRYARFQEKELVSTSMISRFDFYDHVRDVES